MYVVDRIFLTWYSTDALAAALPSSLLHWTLISLPLGTLMYANAFVAQYEGAGRKERVSAVLWQGIYIALVCGGAILACVPFSPLVFAWFHHDPEVARLEQQFFNLLCIGGTPLLLGTALSCFFSGRGRTTVVMWVNIIASLINVALDYLLIFGAGPIPPMGIRGAGVATSIAYTSAAAMYSSISVV
jgi:MATE family multidrug resistance protein